MSKIHMQPYPLFAASVYFDADVTVGRVVAWAEDEEVESATLKPLVTSWGSGHGVAELVADDNVVATYYASSSEKARAAADVHVQQIKDLRAANLREDGPR